MKIDAIITSLIDREGGYVNRASDRGGPTKYGITQAVARANGYSGDMRDLPLSLARLIYERSYYTGPGFDAVAVFSILLAEELVDTGVNMGVVPAATFLQRALNVLNQRATKYSDLRVDGHIGPATLNALAAYLKGRPNDGERVLLTAINCLQGARYIELAEKDESQEDYAFGWLSKRVAL